MWSNDRQTDTTDRHHLIFIVKIWQITRFPTSFCTIYFEFIFWSWMGRYVFYQYYLRFFTSLPLTNPHPRLFLSLFSFLNLQLTRPVKSSSLQLIHRLVQLSTTVMHFTNTQNREENEVTKSEPVFFQEPLLYNIHKNHVPAGPKSSKYDAMVV